MLTPILYNKINYFKNINKKTQITRTTTKRIKNKAQSSPAQTSRIKSFGQVYLGFTYSASNLLLLSRLFAGKIDSRSFQWPTKLIYWVNEGRRMV